MKWCPPAFLGRTIRLKLGQYKATALADASELSMVKVIRRNGAALVSRPVMWYLLVSMESHPSPYRLKETTVFPGTARATWSAARRVM